LREKLTRASFAVTISEHNRRLLARRLPDVDLARLETIHCGVRLAELPYTRDHREPTRIVAVGRLDPIKGFAYLIAACRLLRDRGHAIDCTVIGEGPLRGELASAIAS